MRALLPLLIALLLSPVATLIGEETNLAERELRQLVEEGRRIVERAQRPDGTFDEKELEGRFQKLISKYDAFVHRNEEFAVGFVAYGKILEEVGRPDAAKAMYIKADKLDPKIALVKNQLGNFHAEEGDFKAALTLFMAAINLEPTEPLYPYQLGTLLHEFRDDFIKEEIFDRATIDRQMLQAFSEAARLAPDQIAFTYRHAEAYYDLKEPKWLEALSAWDAIRKKVNPGLETEAIDLHRARIFLETGRQDEAEELLKTIEAPELRHTKERLKERF